jgi:Peptidase family M23
MVLSVAPLALVPEGQRTRDSGGGEPSGAHGAAWTGRTALPEHGLTRETQIMSTPVVLRLPFMHRWAAQNSPARRVPSHGTNLMGLRYSIDFVGVDDRHRTAPLRDWRTLFATEPPERFYAYGRPILAPCDGIVVDLHDGEIDHVARRSQLTLVPYALGQTARLRHGVTAVAGNFVTIRHGDSGTFVTLVHLRQGSIQVGIGEEVTAGQQIAECGNSGNSTQPHVHLQATDSADFSVARGLPITFRHYREWQRSGTHVYDIEDGMPGESAVVEPLP